MRQRVFLGAILMSFLMIGCEKEQHKLTTQDSRDISEEAVVDSYYQDLDDLAGVVIQTPTEDEYAGGRKAATIVIQDARFSCEGIVVTIEPGETSTPDQPKGVIVVDFGLDGCADLRGNIRKGKLIFTYDGRRFVPGSTVVTTTENYFINGVKLEGTRTSVNISGSTQDAPKFNVVLVNGKATFEDGSFALRNSDITVSWLRANNPVDDKLIIHMESTATGVTRGGREYDVMLLKQLEYKRFCPIAVSGIKKYLIDYSKEITIDYGAGTCDRSITVTVEGVTRTMSIG